MTECTGCGRDSTAVALFYKGLQLCNKCHYRLHGAKQKASNLKYARANRKKLSESVKARAALWTDEEKLAKKKYLAEYYKKNKKTLMEKQKIYVKANQAKINAYCAKRSRDKRETDVHFKLTGNLRGRLYKAVRGITKSGSSVTDLGCTVAELKTHLEAQFSDGMSWDNWSPKGWHIDHILPLSSFDLSDRDEFLKANHYTNLQPLWAVDNLKKSNKVV